MKRILLRVILTMVVVGAAAVGPGEAAVSEPLTIAEFKVDWEQSDASEGEGWWDVEGMSEALERFEYRSGGSKKPAFRYLSDIVIKGPFIDRKKARLEFKDTRRRGKTGEMRLILEFQLLDAAGNEDSWTYECGKVRMEMPVDEEILVPEEGILSIRGNKYMQEFNIDFFQEKKAPVLSFDLKSCFPTRFSLPRMDSRALDQLRETVSIVVIKVDYSAF